MTWLINVNVCDKLATLVLFIVCTRGEQKVCVLALYLFNDIRYRFLVIYYYHVFLAQVERLSMLHSRLQICTPFNMAALGTSGHSRKRQVWMIQVVLMNPIFLISRMTKSAKRCQILSLHSLVKTVWKTSNILSASWCCATSLFYTGIY